MDALKIYKNGATTNSTALVNLTRFVNMSDDDLSAIFEDYSMLETLDYWPHQIILGGLYTTMAVLSFLLNFLTIVVLVKGDKICSELYLFLINLSLSDILMSLLCIPYTYTNFIKNRWTYPFWLCPLVNFAQITSVFVSVGTMSAIALDRYFAIIHPLDTANDCISISCSQFCEKRSRKLLLIIVIWLVGVGAGSVQLFYTYVVSFPYGHRTLYDCRENLPEQYAKLYSIFIFLCSFLVPLLILVYVYSIIGYQVWRHVAPGNPHQARDHSNTLTRDKVIKILILIVVLFFLLWMPLQIFNLFVEFDDNFLQIRSASDYRFFVVGYIACHLLAMSHSLVNPCLYCFYSRTFWQNFCSLTRRFFVRIANCCHGSQPRHRVVRWRDRSQQTAHSLVNSTISLFKKRPFSPGAEANDAVPEQDGAQNQAVLCTATPHWKSTGARHSNTIELKVINL